MLLLSLLLACTSNQKDTSVPANDVDADADGYGAHIDCDDASAAIHPGAAEVCDGLDQDCDEEVDEGAGSTWYADADGDGFGDAAVSTTACEASVGWVTDTSDCDDSDATVFPNAAEVCDGVDQDCDGEADEALLSTFYADADGDGFGDAAVSATACEASAGWVTDTSDCDDTRADVFPAAAEVCDGVDQDCDGEADEALLSTFYADTDGDGFGDAAVSATACEASAGWVTDTSDCNDSDATVFPNAAEVCDGLDQDCDGEADEALLSTFYADADGDGFGTEGATLDACAAPEGYAAQLGDCDDTRADVFPTAAEVCDGVDQDCDDETDEALLISVYADTDGDGFGDAAMSTTACEASAGWVTDTTDCDDNDATVFPNAAEVCDGVDQDCDDETDEALLSTFYADADGDGFGTEGATLDACAAPEGYAAQLGDCDDTRADVFPAAAEVCDGVDQDCDAAVDEDLLITVYADADGDGFGTEGAPVFACALEAGLSDSTTDCNDSDATIAPSAAEVPYDGIDQDCDGADLTDADEDGFISVEAGGDDCDDTSDLAFPGGVEIPDDALDNDCDGQIDPVTETWVVAGADVTLTTMLVTGLADPDQSIQVDAGSGGTGDIEEDGRFSVRMNTTSTGVIQLLDADGNIVGMRVLPKADGLAPPHDVQVDHEETVLSLVLLQPGLASSNPYATAVIYAYARSIADEAALATAADALAAHLSSNPTELFDYPVEVQTFVDELADQILTDAFAVLADGSARMRSNHRESTSALNGIFEGEGADIDDAYASFTSLDAEAATGTIQVINGGYRWLSVYLDTDESNTSFTATGDSRWLGLVQSRELELPNAGDIAWALAQAAWDIIVAKALDPNNADATDILATALDDFVTDIANNEEENFVFSTTGELEPFRQGRLMIAGGGKGSGAEAGSRDLLPDILTYTTVFAIPLFEIVLDTADFIGDPDMTECQQAIMNVPDYATTLTALALDFRDSDWGGLVENLGALFEGVLRDDHLLKCFGVQDVITSDLVTKLLSQALFKSTAVLEIWDFLADTGSSAGTMIGWLTTVNHTPPGASYSVSIVDRDDDLVADIALGGTDCDDWRSDVSPRLTETCDGADNDCNGTIDDGVTLLQYVDGDSDNYGGGAAIDLASCTLLSGYSLTGDDCDDTDPNQYPNATEVVNGEDDNCNLLTDEATSSYDDDGDGYSEDQGDCNDANAAIHPNQTEVSDGVDQDCDDRVDDIGAWYAESVDTTGDIWDNPRIVVDSTDTTHLVWQNDAGYVVHAVPGDFGWTTTTVSAASGDLRDMDICLTSDDGVHVVWSDESVDDIYYATIDGTTVSRQTLDSDYYGSYSYSYGHVGIACDSSNMVHIVYSESNDQRLKYASSATDSFSFSNLSTADVETPHGAADPTGGGVGFAYQEANADDGAFLYRSSGGSVSTSTFVTSGLTGRNPRLAFDAAGTPSVAYWDEGNDHVAFARWNGTNWTITTIADASDSSRDGYYGLGHVIDQSGAHHVVYALGSSYAWDVSLYHSVSSDSGATWTTELIRDTSSLEDLDVAIDSYGDLHLALYEDGDLLYMYRY